MNHYKTLSKNTVIFAIGQLSVKVIQFFLMPLVTVSLTSADYGIAENISSLVELLMPLFTLGLTDAVFRFSMRESISPKTVLTSSMTVALSGIVIIAVGCVCIGFFYNYIYVIMFGLLYITMAFSNIWGQFARGIGRVKTYAASGIVQALALALTTYIFVFHLRMGITGYLLSLVIARGSATLLLFFFGGVVQNLSFKMVDKGVLKDMLKYALPLIPNGLCWWFMQVVNRYILTFMCSASISGLYVSSLKIASIINIFSTIFQQAWTISAVKTIDDKDKGKFNTNVFTFYSSFLQIATSALLLVLQGVSMFLLQGEFYEVWRYSALAIFTASISCYAAFFGAYYGAAMKTKMVFITTLIGAVLNVSICFALVTFIGLESALYASLAGYLGITVSRIISTRKIALIKFNWIKEIPVLLLLFGQTLLITYGAPVLSISVLYGTEAAIFVAICLIRIVELKNACLLGVNVVKNIKEGKKTRAAAAAELPSGRVISEEEYAEIVAKRNGVAKEENVSGENVPTADEQKAGEESKSLKDVKSDKENKE